MNVENDNIAASVMSFSFLPGCMVQLGFYRSSCVINQCMRENGGGGGGGGGDVSLHVEFQITCHLNIYKEKRQDTQHCGTNSMTLVYRDMMTFNRTLRVSPKGICPALNLNSVYISLFCFCINRFKLELCKHGCQRALEDEAFNSLATLFITINTL